MTLLFQNKYIKYKNKYITLKNQLYGGTINESIEHNLNNLPQSINEIEAYKNNIQISLNNIKENINDIDKQFINQDSYINKIQEIKEQLYEKKIIKKQLLNDSQDILKNLEENINKTKDILKNLEENINKTEDILKIIKKIIEIINITKEQIHKRYLYIIKIQKKQKKEIKDTVLTEEMKDTVLTEEIKNKLTKEEVILIRQIKKTELTKIKNEQLNKELKQHVDEETKQYLYEKTKKKLNERIKIYLFEEKTKQLDEEIKQTSEIEDYLDKILKFFELPIDNLIENINKIKKQLNEYLNKIHKKNIIYELLKNSYICYVNEYDTSEKFYESYLSVDSYGCNALNNILLSKIFVKENPNETQINLPDLCKQFISLEEIIYTYLNEKILDEKVLYTTSLFECIEYKNYNIYTLIYALHHIGKNAYKINITEINNLLTNENKIIKLILNLGDYHWISIISILDSYHYYYDSSQESIIKFDNRKQLFIHINHVNIKECIVIEDNIDDSNNLVEKSLLNDIMQFIFHDKLFHNSQNIYSDILLKLIKLDEHYYVPFIKTFMIKHIGNIYAIGDIHGDIITLIICLRDCCNVIKKKEGFDFSQKIIDEDLNTQMNKEWDDISFKEDLNYEWCGDTSFVVFCGDLLDNVRTSIEKKPGEFPFEEARIFKFINAINKQAMKVKGRLFKVLGNHDISNLNGESLGNWPFISKYAKNYEGYKYDDKERINQVDRGRVNYFSKGNPGAKLIGEDDAFVFLMINNFIFVHGGISTELLNIDNIEHVNDSLMSYIYNKENTIFDFDNKSKLNIIFGSNKNGLVTDRYFGHDNITKTEEIMCNKLYQQFTQFYTSTNGKYNIIFPYDINKMKLVIGHCTQAKYNKDELFITTFTENISNNIKNEIIFNEEFGGQVSKYNTIQDIYGITVSCGDRDRYEFNIINNFKPSIFRIDIAMSRGFNFDSNYDKSRIPQVLKIIYNDYNIDPKVTVIKSTFENINIHLTDLNIFPYKGKKGFK